MVVPARSLTYYNSYSVSDSGLVAWPTDIHTNADSIDLRDNALTAIPGGALDSMMDLRILNVANNNIKQTPAEAPMTIPASLEMILMMSNQLESFRLEMAGTAGNQSSLSILSLALNHLSSFPRIGTTIGQSLGILIVNGNKLTMIHTDDLTTLTNLNTLMIDENMISTIHEFPLSFRPPQFRMTIQGNPLHCDAHVMWMKAIVSSMILVIDSPPCSSPPELVGQNWDDISIGEGILCNAKIWLIGSSKYCFNF